MSLSYTETALIEAPKANHSPSTAARLQQIASDAKAAASEALLSTHVASVMLRVASALALGIALVRLVKFYAI